MTGDTKPHLREPKRGRIVKFAKCILAVAVGVAVTAVVTTIRTRAYVTFSQWGSSPVTFYLNPESRTLSAAAAEAAVLSAASAWTTQTHATFSYYYGGRVSDTNLAQDGRNIIIFRHDPDSGGTIGTTYSWMSGYRIFESDTILWDGVYPFYTGTSGCVNGVYVEDVATHELGHFLGMAHTGVWPATMYPYYTLCYTGQRTLQPDDIAGIESIYPPAPGSNTAPVVAISNPVNNALATQGTPVAFAGSAADTQDGNLTSHLVWRSNLDGQIGTGGSFSALLSAGTHTISASVTDSGGLVGSGQVAVTITTACVRATPTVSFTPSVASVAAGTSQQYTLNVTNNDASTCGGSSFTLGSTVPGGWGAKLGTTLLPVAAGSSASTTMTVTAPIDTAAASYQLLATAANSGAPTYSSSASATETILPTNGLTVTVTTSAASYLTGNTIIIYANVQLNGLPAANAVVTLTISKPDGTVQKMSGKTNNTGIVKKSVKVASTWPRGSYLVNATATKSTLTGSAVTSFLVQ